MKNRVVCISDLHIEEGDSNKELKWINHFCSFINESPVEKLIVFVLGDIISCGNSNSYKDAQTIISRIKKAIDVTECEFVFLPGNHDYCNGKIDDFISLNTSETNSNRLFENSNVESIIIENYNFILINTIQNGNYNLPGYVDINQLEPYVRNDKENVILMHHAILNDDGSDHSGIQNNSEFINFLNRKNIKYVIHGHEHINKSTEGLNNIFCYGCGSISSECAKGLINEDESFLDILIDKDHLFQIVKHQYHSGQNTYESHMVYPNKTKRYKNVLDVKKKMYQEPLNYIDRKLIENDTDDISYYLFENEYKETSISALEKNGKIVMLANATIGKTTELQYMAYYLSQCKAKYPVLIKLHCYINESIEKLICNEAPMYKDINYNCLTLLFDGYDEINDDTIFSKELQKYLENYNSDICISMRSNFYRELTLFKDFSLFKLLELDEEEVKKVLEKNGIDSSHMVFNDELESLLKNPFYLPSIVELYKRGETINNKNQVIDYLIKKSISIDKNKFEYKGINDEINENNVVKSCTKLALCLVMKGINEIDYDDYCKLIKPKDRELIKNCSMITKSINNKYSFVHNIYKEYFVAKRLVNLDETHIKELVTIDENKRIINESWFNVLDLALRMNKLKKGYMNGCRFRIQR